MWIAVTLVATVFQITRTATQHRLRAEVGINAAGYARYLAAAPVALVAAAIGVILADETPQIPLRFWPIVVGAGIAQILATLALLTAFRIRDFAVGTVYAKTEVVQVAVVSAVLLGEPIAPLAWIGVALVLVGVAWLAAPAGVRSALRLAGDPAAAWGAAAGGGFALAAVGIRAASTSIADAPAVLAALVTLAAMLSIQTILNGAQLAWSDRDALVALTRQPRMAVTVGMLSLGGSAAWAIAVTLENAARVRVLGQVEVVIAFAVGVLALGEPATRAELAAAAVVVVGVGTVVVAG